MKQKDLEIATLGGGCFWCVEAVFQQVNGVEQVIPGYSGGEVKNPSYEAVCTGTTGHAEVCQIVFDPSVVSYREILEIFWMTHDPTTPNRQGNDVGPQYRSAIFYHTQQQKETAEKLKEEIEKENVYPTPIITEITEFRNFYEAELYHHNYYLNHPEQGYCAFVIRPKMNKFYKTFSQKVKG